MCLSAMNIMKDKINNYEHLKTKPCIYMLEVEPGFYKFGKTTNMMSRLRTHFNDMNFINIIDVFDCVDDRIMKDTETELKSYARSIGSLVKKYHKTEIINTNDINIYTDYVKRLIEEKLAHQPIKEKIVIKEVIIEQVVIKEVLIDNLTIDETVVPAICDKFTCADCGKVFKLVKDLGRHRNRKTPCVIREVTPEIVANPNHCIYCNKVYAHLRSLTRHVGACKIRNGEMDNHIDNRKYNQDIYLLKKRVAELENQIKMPIDKSKDNV